MGQSHGEWYHGVGCIEGLLTCTYQPLSVNLKGPLLRRMEGGMGIRLSLDVPFTSKFSSSVDLGLLLLFSHYIMSYSRDPMDCSPPVSSVCGILQARILERVAVPSFRASSRPRDRTRVSCLAGEFFASEPPGKPRLGTQEYKYERNWLC